jgi:hypothetical protein
MKSLTKTHKEYILKMINDGDKIEWIESYCLGAGFDTKNYLSPVYISENKVSITCRRQTTYYNF